jgi:hypothetical protein
LCKGSKLGCAARNQQVSWSGGGTSAWLESGIFVDLIAWQKVGIAREVYLLTEEFSKSEMFDLPMQLRLSSFNRKQYC